MSSSKQGIIAFYLCASLFLLLFFSGLTLAADAKVENEISDLDLKEVINSSTSSIISSSSVSPLVTSSTGSANFTITVPVTGNVTISSVFTSNSTTGNGTTLGNGTSNSQVNSTIHSTTETENNVFIFFLWILFCILLVACILCCCSICLKESPDQRRRTHQANIAAFDDHPSGWVRNDGARMAHWPQVQPVSPYSAPVAY